MRTRIVWIHLKSLVKPIHRLAVPPCVVQGYSAGNADRKGERIGILCPSYLCDALVCPSYRCKVDAVPVMSRRIVRIELDGPLEFSLGASPVPLVGGLDISQCSVRFRQRVVERESSAGRLHCFGGGLPGGKYTVEAVQRVAIGQPGPSQRVGRVFADRLLEIFGGPFQGTSGPLVP